jgi:hypothetical protein
MSLNEREESMNSENKKETHRFYIQLRERINQLRMGHLFEEPCPIYEPEWDDDLWDCRLTYDHDEED